jgi:DNA-binding transcriptional LysR family regulator
VKGVLRGTVRIGLMQSFAFLDVADLLGRFHRQHPGVEIQLRPSAGGSQSLVEQLRRGDIDIAFVSATEDPVGVSTTELGVEDLHLVGTAELLPPRRPRIDLSALSEATFVDFPRDGESARRSTTPSTPPASTDGSPSKSPTSGRAFSCSGPGSASPCFAAMPFM